MLTPVSGPNITSIKSALRSSWHFSRFIVLNVSANNISKYICLQQIKIYGASLETDAKLYNSQRISSNTGL